jgi:hypothetical protein
MPDIYIPVKELRVLKIHNPHSPFRIQMTVCQVMMLGFVPQPNLQNSSGMITMIGFRVSVFVGRATAWRGEVTLLA